MKKKQRKADAKQAKRLSLIAYAALAVVVVLTAVAITVVAVQSSTWDDRGNLIGNNGSYGIAVPVGDDLYYANDGILCMEKGATEPRKLTADNAMYLSHKDGYLYYSNVSDKGRLYRIRTDGSGKEKLNDLRTESIEIVGNQFFYATTILGGETDTSQVGIYKFDPKTKESKRLNSVHADHLAWLKGRLYFTDRDAGYTLCSVRGDGSDQQTLVDEFVYSFEADQKNLYVATKKELLKMDYKGKQREIVTELSASAILLMDESTILYLPVGSLGATDESMLKKLDLNTKISTTVSNGSFMAVNKVDEDNIVVAAYGVTMQVARINMNAGTVISLPSGK